MTTDGSEEGTPSTIRRSTRERKKPKQIYEVEDPRLDSEDDKEKETEAEGEEDEVEQDDDEEEKDDGEEEEEAEDESEKKSKKATKTNTTIKRTAPRRKMIAKKNALVKPRKLRPVKEGNEDDEDEDNEEENEEDGEHVLFDAIKRGKCSIHNLMVEWRDRYEENEEEATREVLNFVLQSCGGVGQCVPTTEKLDNLDMSDLVDNVVDDLAKSNEDYPIASRSKINKRFYRNFVDFWNVFVNECFESELLFTTSLIPQFVDWLTTLSSAEVRAIRHTTTIAAYALGNALVDCASSLTEKLAVAKRQLNAEMAAARKASNRKSPSRTPSKKMEQLKENKKLYEERIQHVLQLITLLFTGVIVHRYRDVMPEIRIESVQTLGKWIEALPDHFLKDNYLKYLGWVLNDKHASVRLADVEILRQLYENEAFTSRMELFTSRFLARFLELCNDIDDQVVQACIRLLIAVDKRNLINSEVDLQSVEMLVFDPNSAQIRKAAAEFVCLQYDAFGVAENKKLTKEQLNTQAIALVEFAEEYITNHNVPAEAVTTLVDAFWGLDDCQVLQDWQLLINLLLVDKTAPDLTSDQQTILIRLLVAAVQRIMDDEGATIKKKASKDKEEIAVTFCKEIPNLLVLYQSDAEKLSLLVELVPMLSLESDSIGQHLGHVKGLLERLKHAYLSHSEEALLKVLSQSISHLFQSTNEPIKRAADVIVHEIFQSVLDQLLQLLAEDAKMTDVQLTSETISKAKRRSSKSKDLADLEYALRMHLCRLKCLVQYLNMRDYLPEASNATAASPRPQDEAEASKPAVVRMGNLMSGLLELIQRRTKNILQLSDEVRDAGTIKHSLLILYTDLLWVTKPVFAKGTEVDASSVREQIEKIRTARGLLEDALVSVLEMHLEKTRASKTPEDDGEENPAEEQAEEDAHMEEISLDDAAVAAYVKEAQRVAFMVFCDTRCLFIEKFRDAPAPYDSLEWVLPKILVLLTQMYFENEMQSSTGSEQPEDEEQTEATGDQINKTKEQQQRKVELLVALGRASLCNPGNKRQAAAVLSYLTDNSSESLEVVKAFSKQVKAETPVRYLEIQMTVLRQMFTVILTMQEELQDEETDENTKEELQESIATTEAELRDLSKKLSQSLGVGKIASSLRAPFFRFVCEGVRFSLEKPEHFAFFECLRPYVSHLDRASMKQLKAYFDQMLEEMKDMPQEEDGDLDPHWRLVFDFQAAISSDAPKPLLRKKKRDRPAASSQRLSAKSDDTRSEVNEEQEVEELREKKVTTTSTTRLSRRASKLSDDEDDEPAQTPRAKKRTSRTRSKTNETTPVKTPEPTTRRRSNRARATELEEDAETEGAEEEEPTQGPEETEDAKKPSVKRVRKNPSEPAQSEEVPRRRSQRGKAQTEEDNEAEKPDTREEENDQGQESAKEAEEETTQKNEKQEKDDQEQEEKEDSPEWIQAKRVALSPSPAQSTPSKRQRRSRAEAKAARAAASPAKDATPRKRKRGQPTDQEDEPEPKKTPVRSSRRLAMTSAKPEAKKNEDEEEEEKEEETTKTKDSQEEETQDQDDDDEIDSRRTRRRRGGR